VKGSKVEIDSTRNFSTLGARGRVYRKGCGRAESIDFATEQSVPYARTTYGPRKIYTYIYICIQYYYAVQYYVVCVLRPSRWPSRVYKRRVCERGTGFFLFLFFSSAVVAPSPRTTTFIPLALYNTQTHTHTHIKTHTHTHCSLIRREFVCVCAAPYTTRFALFDEIPGAYYTSSYPRRVVYLILLLLLLLLFYLNSSDHSSRVRHTNGSWSPCRGNAPTFGRASYGNITARCWFRRVTYYRLRGVGNVVNFAERVVRRRLSFCRRRISYRARRRSWVGTSCLYVCTVFKWSGRPVAPHQPTGEYILVQTKTSFVAVFRDNACFAIERPRTAGSPYDGDSFYIGRKRRNSNHLLCPRVRNACRNFAKNTPGSS